MSDANAQKVMDKVRTLYKEAPEGLCDRLSQLIGSSEIAYLNVRSDEDRTMHVVVFTRCAVLLQTFIADRSRLDVTLKGWPRRQLEHVDFSASMAVNATAEDGVYEVGPTGNAVALVHYKNQGPITLLANSTNDPAEFVAFLPSLLAD